MEREVFAVGPEPYDLGPGVRRDERTWSGEREAGGAGTSFWVYIVANRRNGTIYTGHTDNLYARTLQHRDGTFGGFTARYGCKALVWAEEHPTREAAFQRVRAIKEWRRAWKLDLIEAENPTWRDLFDEMFRVGVDAKSWALPDPQTS